MLNGWTAQGCGMRRTRTECINGTGVSCCTSGVLGSAGLLPERRPLQGAWMLPQLMCLAAQGSKMAVRIVKHGTKDVQDEYE